MTEKELAAQLDIFYKEQFELKFKKGSGQLESPAKIKELRRNIAKIKTFQRLKQEEV